MIELALVHQLASLLWRLRRASAIETGLFEIRGEFLLARSQDRSHRPSQTGTLPTRTLANGHKTVLGSNGRDDVHDVHAPAARTVVEFPRHRPMFPAPFQS
jgi:hypothetical protein